MVSPMEASKLSRRSLLISFCASHCPTENLSMAAASAAVQGALLGTPRASRLSSSTIGELALWPLERSSSYLAPSTR
ncbi:hypothetical protein D9M68_937470 [compost metagenome]